MKISKNSKFAFVGHGLVLYELIKFFKKNKLKEPIVITHKKKFHHRDILEHAGDKSLYRDIFEISKIAKTYFVDDINEIKTLNLLKKNKITHIFSISSRFIFKDKILKTYYNKIFNIHGTLLPKEKGSGIYSYRIFNNEFFCGATIHLVKKNLDSGKILLQTKKIKINKNSLPIHIIRSTNKIYIRLIKIFIKNILNNKKFKLKVQNQNNSTFYNRFYTDKMGLIDFDWNGEEISQFIKGLSRPYSGAFCFVNFKLKKIKLKIFNSTFYKTKKNHPFLSGKVYFEDKKKIKIFVRNGIIIISKKFLKFHNANEFKLLGRTLYSNIVALKYSKTNNISVFKFKSL